MDWPEQGRLVGIDFGTVRIGLAICDPSRRWASPLTTYRRRSEDLDQQYFQQLVQDESVTGWVIGLPIHCDGQESQKSGEVRRFAAWLTQHTHVPVQFIDERFSTAHANRLLETAELSRAKTKKTRDKIAAHVILESFLERSQHSDIHHSDIQRSLED